jgi:hypothetical protein
MKFDDASEWLTSPELTDVERRIAAYVYPLTDPALEALVSAGTDRATTLRKTVLARGRDGRELARSLQLPIGTAVLQTGSLAMKVSAALAGLASQVDAFVMRESKGHANLHGALESLRQVPVGMRRYGFRAPLNALEYLVLRYENAALGDSPPATTKKPYALVDVEKAEPASSATLSQALRIVQDTLTREVKDRAPEWPAPRSKGAKAALRLIAPIAGFAVGELFAGIAASSLPVAARAAAGGTRGSSKASTTSAAAKRKSTSPASRPVKATKQAAKPKTAAPKSAKATAMRARPSRRPTGVRKLRG